MVSRLRDYAYMLSHAKRIDTTLLSEESDFKEGRTACGTCWMPTYAHMPAYALHAERDAIPESGCPRAGDAVFMPGAEGDPSRRPVTEVTNNIKEGYC